MTLRDLASHLGAGALTAAAAVDTALTACATVGRAYNSVVDQSLHPESESTTLDDQARAAATAADIRWDSGTQKSALDGIPFAIKDVIDLAGVTTTMGSHVAPEAPADTSAAVVEIFEEMGMIPVAKTTCHEHSYGIMGEESIHGKGVNPIRPGLITGGSSYGSAIAVATGVVPVAIGTDTAGSVRVPAACAGITGFKPSLGRVPTEGVAPLSTSLDTVGFFTRTPADMQLLWRELVRHMGDAAHTPAPDASQRTPGDAAAATSNAAAVRLGVLTTRFADTGAEWFDTRARPTLSALAGVELVTVDEAPFAVDRVPHIFAAIRGYETHQVHAPSLRAGRRDFQPQVMRNLDNDAAITREEYEDALAELAELRDRAEPQLAGYDALVIPTTGCELVEWAAVTPHIRNQLRRYTQLINLLGWPAISVPVGRLGPDSDPREPGGTASEQTVPEAPADFPASVQFVMGPDADTALVDLLAGLVESHR